MDSSRRRQRKHRPDFLVEYAAGFKALIEVKGANYLDSQEVQRKRVASAGG